MPLTIKEIWLLSEDENKEADRTISEKELEKYTGAVIEGKIPWVEINQEEDQELVISAAKDHDIVVVSGPDYSIPKIIALENLIAETQKYNTKLFSFAKNSEEVYSVSFSLGLGMNVIVRNPDLIPEFREYFSPINFELASAEIESTKSDGYFGDRCCIDTISLMSEGEGMLVGASPNIYFLVHAETEGSEFTRPRPFRVNAGPLSNYIITAKKEEIETRYLWEIGKNTPKGGQGDPVLAVNYKGEARRIIVNNNKTEPREFIKISTDKGSILLQNAETVCLTTPNGKQIPVTDLKPGDKVLVYESAGGMHCGTQYHRV